MLEPRSESRHCTSRPDEARLGAEHALEAADQTMPGARARQRLKESSSQAAEKQGSTWPEAMAGGEAASIAGVATADQLEPLRASGTHAARSDGNAARRQLATVPAGFHRYATIEEVGRGGCGVVARARDLQLDRDVVIKRIIERYSAHSEIVDRFINEAKITGQLEHPGIVPVYEFGIDDSGAPYYAMKQVKGVTLATKIRELHRLEDQRTFKQQRTQLLQRFLSVCQTLAFAHQAGVIHRDLKPANVMIGEFGETILLDWGLARRLRSTEGHSETCEEEPTLVAGRSHPERTVRPASDAADTHRLSSEMTRQGVVLGTATYMAPEQAMGLNDRVNEQSDVFALGVMLYEILSGISPFRCDSLETTMERVVRCDYRPLSRVVRGLPRPLLAICQHAMQADQKARYRDARELASDLQSYLSGGPVSVYREALWERLDRTAENHRGVFRAGFGACLLVTAVSLVAVGKVTTAHRSERAARLVAVEAQNKAESALTSERLAREQTQKQLHASRAAADAWLINLSGDLQFYPGLEGLRGSLISQGREHYADLLKSATEQLIEIGGQKEAADQYDRAIQEVLACRLRLGDLFRLNGDLKSACEQYELSRQLLDQTAQPLAPTLQVQLANAIIGQSLIEVEQRGAASTASPLAAGIGQESSPSIDRALAILGELLKRDPAMADARNALARALLIDARWAEATGNAQRASEQLSAALMAVNMLAEQADSAKLQTLKRTILEDRARLYYRAREFAAASEAADDWIRYLDQLQKLHPDRPDLFEGRAVAHSLLSAIRLAMAQPQGSIEASVASHTDLDAAWDLLFGEAFYRENLAVISANRAAAHELLGDHDAAIEQWRNAIAEWRWLVQSDGVNLQRIKTIARGYLSLTRLLLDASDLRHDQSFHEETSKLLEQTEVLMQHLTDEGINIDELRVRYDLLVSLRALQTGELSKAEESLADALNKLTGDVSGEQAEIDEPSRALLEVEAKLVKVRLQLTQEPNAEVAWEEWPWPAEPTQPLTLHAAAVGVFERMAERWLESADSVDVGFLLGKTEEWVVAQDRSPQAWDWLATWALVNDDIETAERARRQAVQLRLGNASKDEELIAAIVNLLKDPNGAGQVSLAVAEQLAAEGAVTFQGKVLRRLLHHLHVIPTGGSLSTDGKK